MLTHYLVQMRGAEGEEEEESEYGIKRIDNRRREPPMSIVKKGTGARPKQNDGMSSGTRYPQQGTPDPGIAELVKHISKMTASACALTNQMASSISSLTRDKRRI